MPLSLPGKALVLAQIPFLLIRNLVSSGTNLHILGSSPCIDAGLYNALNPNDIDGDARTIGTTDIGADEAICGTPLAGTYTIGGSSPDYTDFSSAVADLILCGVSAPVIFDVRDGTYTEQISIPAITGASGTNTITFRGEKMDSTTVLLTWPSSSSSLNNYVIELIGAEYFRFEHMHIHRSASLIYGRAMYYEGAQQNIVSNCVVEGSAFNGSSTNAATIFSSTTALEHYNDFFNNRIEEGSYGIFFNGTTSTNLYGR